MNFSILLAYRSATRFWAAVVILFIVGIGYILNKLTKGYTVGYLRCKISENTKKTLTYIHGLGSLILALIIPNNFLNETDFFKELFDANELWIAASVVTLLFLFVAFFGAVFTFIARRKGVEKTAND